MEDEIREHPELKKAHRVTRYIGAPPEWVRRYVRGFGVYRHCRLCFAARDETPGLWFSVVAASAARNVYELDLRER
jgi:hypothetical protein